MIKLQMIKITMKP